jgi:SAM-dependent methyltransferase
MAGERIHEDRAELYDRIYQWKEYAAEALQVRERLRAEGVPDGARVLEGACGTGNYLVHLAAWYEVEGFDLAEGMLARARTKLPDARLRRADLERFSVDEPVHAFLCLFSSIGYVGPLDALERAAARVAAALRPGGVALVQPWFSPATIVPGHPGLTTYVDPDLKLARADVVRVDGRRTVLDFHWLVARRGAPGVERFEDRHVLWLYTPDELVGAFRKAGLEARYETEETVGPLASRGLLVVRKPPASAGGAGDAAPR